MAGLLSSAVFALLIVVTTTFGASAALMERRVALVIGNSIYKNTNLSLANPKNDADDVAGVLKSLGFEVIQSTDASKRDIDVALQRFARAATNADSALFFYAGHAMQYQGRNYLMPVDAELEDEVSLRYNMVLIDDVRVALDRASGVKIMILDACRNNPLADKFMRTLMGATRAAMSTRGLARVDKTQGMVVAYATAADDVAMDGNNARNSPFTTALLKRMQEPGLEIEMMFRRIASDVNAQTSGRQRPETYISLLSEYYLNQSDRLVWEKLRDSGDIVAIREFMTRFPYSVHAWDAKYRLDILERSARERDEQARLQREREKGEREAAQRREIEEKLQKLEAERRKEETDAVQREAERRREAQERLAKAETDRQRTDRERAERETAEQRAEAERLARIEAERKKVEQEEAERQAAKRKADEARIAMVETERRQREEAARKQEAAERLAKLEAERVQAQREAKERETARLREQAERQKAERNCQLERATLGAIETNLGKLQTLVNQSTCEEVRIAAGEKVAALTAQRELETQACKREDELLALLKGTGAEAKQRLVEFQKQMTCERLRPVVVAILSKPDAPAAPDASLIRNTQIALRRIGCFSGADTGEMNDATRSALKRFLSRTDRNEADLRITPELLTEIEAQQPGTCPLVCPAGKVARGDTCIVERPNKPPVRAERPRPERTAAPPRSLAPPVAERAPAAPAPRAEAKPGSAPRALGIGF
jgi:uncharacterized caspase-like protein